MNKLCWALVISVWLIIFGVWIFNNGGLTRALAQTEQPECTIIKEVTIHANDNIPPGQYRMDRVMLMQGEVVIVNGPTLPRTRYFISSGHKYWSKIKNLQPKDVVKVEGTEVTFTKVGEPGIDI